MKTRILSLAAIYIAIVFLAIGCDQSKTSITGANETSHPGQPESSLKIESSDWRDDPGMFMRQEFRSLDNTEFVNRIEKGERTVMIGFKEENAERGVDRHGKALVNRNQAELFADQIIPQFADSVLYKFKHIPAIAVKLKNSEMAVELRNLPWIDYVVAGSGLVTPDAVSLQCSSISSPQTIPWNITQVGADYAWSVATGDNAPGRLVVLDDGADEDNGWHGIELDWEAYTFYVPSTTFNGTHGTPVLGAAQANDNNYGTVGVAPDAMARVMKIFDPNYTSWEIHSAIAVDDNAALADVMTISYSTKITSSTPPSSFTGFYDAINNAYNQHNVVFTASTGNQERSDFYAFPANFDEVIGVGGSDKNDEYVFNNYAPGNVEVAAPAVDILTVCKGGDIGEFNGTSFGTPMVAGAVMLLRDQNPTWSNDQIRQQLENTALPMSDQTKSGAGRIEVAAALGLTPALEVTITGPTNLDHGQQSTWQANVENASGSVSYQWFVQDPLGDPWQSTSQTTDSFTWTFFNDTDAIRQVGIRVDITDAVGQATDTHYVTISPSCGSNVFFC